MLNKYFWNTEKQMSGCIDNAGRLWKTTVMIDASRIQHREGQRV